MTNILGLRSAASVAAMACGLVLSAGSASAATTFSGFVNDPTNTALVHSDLTAALFGDDYDIANNVALHTFSVAAAGNYTFDSNGFDAGGIDPYFTLFSGTGLTATFVASNYVQAFSTGGDFLINLALAAGDYTIALGTFANMSSAENYLSGSLGDGFIFLGGASFLGNYYYELTVDIGEPPTVPEPSTLLLLALGTLGLGLTRRASRGT